MRTVLLVSFIAVVSMFFSGCLGESSTTCGFTSNCDKNHICVNGVCVAPPSCREQGDACGTSNECCSGLTCSEYKCIKPPEQPAAKNRLLYIRLIAVTGYTDVLKNNIVALNISYDGKPPDFSQFVVKVSNKDHQTAFAYSSTSQDSTHYTISDYAGRNRVNIVLPPQLYLPVNTNFRIELLPGDNGLPITLDGTTPTTYPGSLITLYP